VEIGPLKWCRRKGEQGEVKEFNIKMENESSYCSCAEGKEKRYSLVGGMRGRGKQPQMQGEEVSLSQF